MTAASIAAAGARRWRVAEDALGTGALGLMAALPLVDFIGRLTTGVSLPGGTGYVQNLTLWVGFIGAVIAARAGSHLTLSTGGVFARLLGERRARLAVAIITSAVAAGLAWASLRFLLAETSSPVTVGGWLPMWAILAVLPFSFALIALRYGLGPDRPRDRLIALAGPALAVVLGFLPAATIAPLAGPAIAVIIASALIGTPIFAVLGGCALLLFAAADVPVAAIPVETYRIVESPAIPTIPLFVLTGYLLAGGRAGERLIRLFSALFGWIPGGLAIVVVLACAFFSTFTGASGVTILALGGLLLPVLINSGYTERFSLGLVTSSGSIGLLFPPSLAVILYGVVAHVPIPDLFAAGVGPGLVMVLAVSAMAMVAGIKSRAPRPAFRAPEAVAALWGAKWEIGLPLVAIGGIFGGFTTLAEAAALTASYAFFTQVVIHREIHPLRDLPGLLIKCVIVIGGVFAILGVALGLTNYLVDAEIPARAAAWVEAHVHSRVLFLLALNIFLLIVGCLMDIYAATVVVVPLILPISQVFGIHPLHLGMIFLVNLELGYLTPPVGLNLFLSALRFERPFPEVCRAVLPFLLVLLSVLIAVTYVPAISLIFAGTL